MDVSVRLPGVLREHAGGRPCLEIPLADGATVGELLDVLASRFPAVERRIRDETGVLRRHVHLFVDAEPVAAAGGVHHRLRDGAEILVLPAVSGGARAPDEAGVVAAAPDAEGLAGEIDRRIRALPHQTTEPVRRVRREYSARLRPASGVEVLAVAGTLVPRQRWVAYELVHHHAGARALLTTDTVMRLGRGIDSWGAVDAFGRFVAGPAWQQGSIPDALVQGWTASPDRWWRRAALVATVPLNLRSAGGRGDPTRTLDICGRLVTDRDDMVVKALSWALRELVPRDPEAVRDFVADHGDAFAPRVRREVANKLATGTKHPAARRRAAR